MGASVAAYAATAAQDLLGKVVNKNRLSTPSSLQAQRKAQADAMLARALNGDTSVLPEMVRLSHESATDDANQVFAADVRKYYATRNIVPDAATAGFIGWQTATSLAATTADLAGLKAQAAANVKFEFTPGKTFGPPLNYRVNSQGNTYDLTSGERLSSTEIVRRWAALGTAPTPDLSRTANGALPASAPIGAPPLGTPAAAPANAAVPLLLALGLIGALVYAAMHGEAEA